MVSLEGVGWKNRFVDGRHKKDDENSGYDGENDKRNYDGDDNVDRLAIALGRFGRGWRTVRKEYTQARIVKETFPMALHRIVDESSIFANRQILEVRLREKPALHGEIRLISSRIATIWNTIN